MLSFVIAQHSRALPASKCGKTSTERRKDTIEGKRSRRRIIIRLTEGNAKSLRLKGNLEKDFVAAVFL